MLNYLTYGQLDDTALKQAGNLGQNDIFIGIRQRIVNNKTMKLYAIADGLNDPFYNKTATLTVAADQEQLTQSVITAINSSTGAITRSSGVFVAGSIISVVLVTKATGAIAYSWIAQIVTGGATATFTVISGTASTFASSTQNCAVSVIKGLSSTSIDLSAIYFKDFLTLSDLEFQKGIHTVARKFDKIVDPAVFLDLPTDYSHDKRVAWFLEGDKILLDVGANANALGTVTGRYRGKPGIWTDSTTANAIEIPPEYNQVLIDEVTASYLIEKGSAVPDDLAARLKSFYDAKTADTASKESTKNK